MSWPIATLNALVAAAAITGCATPSGDFTQKYDEAWRTGSCYIHHESMVHVKVPILHGFFVSADSSRHRFAEFPFADWYTLDGGPLTPSSPAEAQVWHCRSCEAAKVSWMKAHPDDPWVKEERGMQKEPNSRDSATR